MTTYVCRQCSKGGVPLKKCARCQIDRYCSVECQKAAWPVHKQICQHNMVALQESIANGQYTSKGSKDSQRWCLQYTEEITRLSAYALHALPPAECLAEDYVLLVLAKYDEDERSVRLLKAERLPKNLVLKQMPPPEYVKAASEGAVTVMHAFVKVINGCQQVMTLSLHQPMIDSLHREQGELTAEQQEAVYRHYLTVLQADEEMTRCVEKRSDDNDD